MITIQQLIQPGNPAIHAGEIAAFIQGGCEAKPRIVRHERQKCKGRHYDREFCTCLSFTFTVLTQIHDEYMTDPGREWIKERLLETSVKAFEYLSAVRPSINNVDVDRITRAMEAMQKEGMETIKHNQSLVGLCLGLMVAQVDELEESGANPERLSMALDLQGRLESILKYYTSRTHREESLEYYIEQSAKLIKIVEKHIN